MQRKGSCTSDKFGECTRCSTAQLIDKCDLRYTARLDVRSEGNIKTVTAFSPVVEKKCPDTTVSKEKLLCEQFTLTVSERNVIHIIICFIFHVTTYEYYIVIFCCFFVNSRRACAARVALWVCVCVSVCLFLL